MGLLIGIDPGITGGVALLDDNTLLLVDGFVIPSGNGRVLVADLLDELDRWYSREMFSRVVIEDVHSHPKQGVTSVFTFGRALGNLEGMCMAMHWPVAYVSPAVWKRHLKLPTDDKDGARQWARRQWPTSQLFNRKGAGQAIADAAGIAVAWWEMHR